MPYLQTLEEGGGNSGLEKGDTSKYTWRREALLADPGGKVGG